MVVLVIVSVATVFAALAGIEYTGPTKFVMPPPNAGVVVLGVAPPVVVFAVIELRSIVNVELALSSYAELDTPAPWLVAVLLWNRLRAIVAVLTAPVPTA